MTSEDVPPEDGQYETDAKPPVLGPDPAGPGAGPAGEGVPVAPPLPSHPNLSPFAGKTAREHFDAFMRFFTGGLAEPITVEVRAPKTPRRNTDYAPLTAGFFRVSRDPETWKPLWKAVAEIARRDPELQPPGIYILANHALSDLLARACEQIQKVGEGETTSDRHVVSRRHFLVDIDAIRRLPTGEVIKTVCATGAEKEAAVAVGRAVVAELRGRAWPEPLVVDTGNGVALWYAVDLPNDEATKALFERALKALAQKHDTTGATVDPAVFNASRIMRLVGTWNRKGSDTPAVGRVHRPCRVLQAPAERQNVPRELIEALATEYVNPKAKPAPAKAEPKPKGKPAQSAKTSDARARCGAYMRTVAPAVEGDDGSGATIRAARIIWNDFGLDHGDGFPILCDWNARCTPPWPMEGSQGLIRKWNEAVEAGPGPEGRGFKLAEDRPRPSAAPAPHSPPGGGTPAAGGGPAPNPGGDNALPHDVQFSPWYLDHGNLGKRNPDRLARLYLATIDPCQERILRYHSGAMLRWCNGAYEEVPDGEFKADVGRALREEMARLHRMTREQGDEEEDDSADEDEEGDGEGEEAIPVTQAMVRDVVGMIQSHTLLSSKIEAPAWVDDVPGPDPRGLLVLQNGILDVDAFVDGKPDYLMKPCPSFFTRNAVPYDFDAKAPEPKKFLAFLEGIFPNDQQSVDCLQEQFGLFLLPITKYQKVFGWIGKTRSGKGTCLKVLAELIGKPNVCYPTIADLSKPFGLHQLLGKTVAASADERAPTGAELTAAMSAVLRISGEDGMSVSGKYRDDVQAQLLARLLYLTNEVPRLPDNSGAAVGRMVMLHFKECFLGKEDLDLFEKIKATELPGILLWALKGYKRLRDRGKFEQPQSGKVLLDQMRALGAPIERFLEDECVIEPGATVPVDKLFRMYESWCYRSNIREVGTKDMFGQKLLAARGFPRKRASKQPDGTRPWLYEGLRPATETTTSGRNLDEAFEEARGT